MRFRLASGATLNYRTRGAGRVVVLMHPIGCRLEIWDDVIAELEGRCRAIAVDFRGHGGSDTDGRPFSLGDLAGDVVELVRAVASPPVVVVGCSMGGMVAQAIAVEAPDVVSGVVIANTGHARTDAAREMLEGRAKAAANGMPGVIETTLDRWFNETFKRAEPGKVALARRWLEEDDPVVHSHGWRAIRDLNYADRLALVETPALAIAGTEDQSASVDVVKAVAAAMKNCSYREIAGAGHLSPLEQPKEFARLLIEFMDGLPVD